MDIFIDYVKNHKLYLVLAAMILLSVFAVTGYGQYAYYGSMLVLAAYAIKNNEHIEAIFSVLLVWLLISSAVNGVYDWRYLAFILVLACATPFFRSYNAYLFRSKVLFAFCMGLPIVTILNLYAYRAGINYFLLLNENVSELNFSGFLFHPMWLSAINGASNVVLLYLFFKMRGSKWFIKYSVLILLLASIYLSVVAASRSALASSLIAMAAMVYFYSDSGGKLVRNGVVIVILASLLLPYYKSGGEQMQNKMENTDNGGNSRTRLWNMRLQEFDESPIFGVGFATARNAWGMKETGTVETGNGWLTILSQSGLIGALFVLMILKRAYVPISEIKEKRGMLVIFGCEFIYLCVHSCFEGYIYTAGYCPCLFFWLVTGFFYDYNNYGLPIEYDDEDEEDEEYEEDEDSENDANDEEDDDEEDEEDDEYDVDYLTS